MPRATAAEAAETAERILAVATAQFAARGYAAASVDEIAEGVGVTRGAVYHHYSSKPALFAAVAAAQQDRVAEAIVAATADPATALRDGSHAFLDAITDGDSARILLVDGPSALSWEEWRRLDEQGPAAELRTGLAEAGIADALLAPLTAALSGAMNELALWLSERSSDAAARARAHQALDRLLDAVIPS